MILYEVFWDNGEPYEDRMTRSLIYTSLEKAKERFNREEYALPYGMYNETLSLFSFESDDDIQERTVLKERVLPYAPEGYYYPEPEPEPDYDYDFGEPGDYEDAMG